MLFSGNCALDLPVVLSHRFSSDAEDAAESKAFGGSRARVSTRVAVVTRWRREASGSSVVSVIPFMVELRSGTATSHMEELAVVHVVFGMAGQMFGDPREHPFFGFVFERDGFARAPTARGTGRNREPSHKLFHFFDEIGWHSRFKLGPRLERSKQPHHTSVARSTSDSYHHHRSFRVGNDRLRHPRRVSSIVNSN